MTDDLVKRLRWRAASNENCLCGNPVCDEAADLIEKLESVTKDDAKWLAAYHKWCQMNGCAPSSSDLIAASKALEGKDGPWVEAINRTTCLAVMNDGQILSITHWLEDEGECEPEDATSCVCGPCKSGYWYTVDLSEMDKVMQ